MAFSYSWKPLRSIPDLIPACIKIMKEEWPHCKAEILPQLVERELGSAPCSYGLVEQQKDMTDQIALVGHVRFIPVTNRRRAVYAEGFIIDKERRKRGVGLLATSLGERMASKYEYRELFKSIYPHFKEFYLERSFSVSKDHLSTVGANVLLTNNPRGEGPTYVSWHGNTLYPGWEWVYEGGVIASKTDLTDEQSGLLVKKLLS